MKKDDRLGGHVPIVRKQMGSELNYGDLSAIAETLALSFQSYPLFEYFMADRYDVSKMKAFWTVSLKTVKNSACFVTEAEGLRSAAVLIPNEKSDVSVGRYIRSGGLGLIFKIGPRAVSRMLRFESVAAKIKSKYATPTCWYLYLFVTHPDFQGEGYGARVLRESLRFLDEARQDCYLETLSSVNVEIYRHFGFELKETVRIPDTDLTLYAMVKIYKESATDRC